MAPYDPRPAVNGARLAWLERWLKALAKQLKEASHENGVSD